MFPPSIEEAEQVRRGGDNIHRDSLGSFIADDDEVEWVSRTLPESEEELELGSTEPDEEDGVVKVVGYSIQNPKMSCKDNNRIVEGEKEQQVVHSSQHCPLQGHGEGLVLIKAKHEVKRKKRRLVRCKLDSPVIPCLRHEQIDIISVSSSRAESNMKERGSKENDTIIGGNDNVNFDDEPEESARSVLAQCMNISQRLTKAVGAWQEGNVVLKDAISLVDISTSDNTLSSHLFTNAHVSTACPRLSLRPFQLVGVNWLSLMHDEGVNCVLADEMGLGKTVQTIAFLALLYQRRQHAEENSCSLDKKGLDAKNYAPHIIVVPSSVLSNWEKEFQKFCPKLSVTVYHGSAANRADIRDRGWGYYDNVDVILTTYTMWERESNADDRRFILGKNYDYLVLDEGHFIKNARGSRFLRLKRVHCNHRLLLTGTPVQNNIGELLSLLSFLMPDIFDETVVEMAQEGRLGSLLGAEATESEGRHGQENLSHHGVDFVRSMLAPFVLRRLKASVLDQLTEKQVDVQLVQLQPFQQKLYSGIIEKHIRQRTSGEELRAHEARNVFVE